MMMAEITTIDAKVSHDTLFLQEHLWHCYLSNPHGTNEQNTKEHDRAARNRTNNICLRNVIALRPHTHTHTLPIHSSILSSPSSDSHNSNLRQLNVGTITVESELFDTSITQRIDWGVWRNHHSPAVLRCNTHVPMEIHRCHHHLIRSKLLRHSNAPLIGMAADAAAGGVLLPILFHHPLLSATRIRILHGSTTKPAQMQQSKSNCDTAQTCTYVNDEIPRQCNNRNK
mmetsp:Transcript_23006/g.64106  ORF Transcript_23006/g.64106 Transcript_23006/m.64106 type:complete len:228 (-) Transcript_23006:915-1598(-)